jgi:hypothetical protein
MSSILYFAVAYLIPIILGLIVYDTIRRWVKKDIKELLREYANKEPVVSRDLEEFFREKEKALITIGSFAWPITLMFLLGGSFGDIFYQIKTDKSYENRIGAWFI